MQKLEKKKKTSKESLSYGYKPLYCAIVYTFNSNLITYTAPKTAFLFFSRSQYTGFLYTYNSVLMLVFSSCFVA